MSSFSLLRRCIGVTSVTLVCTTLASAVELRELNLDGNLHNADKTRAAKLHVFCSAQANGGFGVELLAADAESLKDFDYDDFEGPDAVASKRALSRISLSGEAGKTEIVRAAGGWYGVEPAGSFVFSVTQMALQAGEVANLFAAFDSHKGHLVWVQTGFDDPKRELRAAFEFDDATAKHLRDVIVPCLPAPKKIQPTKN